MKQHEGTKKPYELAEGLYRKYREVFWYLVCGVGTTVVNLVMFWLCAHLWELQTSLSTGIAWLCSVLFAYVTNRIYVFRSENCDAVSIVREMTAFFGGRMVSGVLDVAFMVLLVDMFQLPPMWMKMIVNVLVTVLNFIFSKCFVFRGHDDGRNESKKEAAWKWQETV